MEETKKPVQSQAEIDRMMARFHKGFAQNVKGVNDLEFLGQFLRALPEEMTVEIAWRLEELMSFAQVTNPEKVWSQIRNGNRKCIPQRDGFTENQTRF